MVYSEVTSHVEKNRATSRYAYDALGRWTVSQDAGGSPMRTLYDAFSFEVIREGESFSEGSFTTRYSEGIQRQHNSGTEGSRYRWIGEGTESVKTRSLYEDGYGVAPGRFMGISVTLYGRGEAVAVSRSASTGSRGGAAYLGKDILGSVRSTTNEYGSLEDRYEYDAFGKPYTGDLRSGMNLGYTGKPYDTATGLYNYGYRDYQPEAARFTTVDPIRDGANWFAYVNNDPVNWVDLWGLETVIFSLPVTPVDKHLFIGTQTEDGKVTTKSLYPESQVKAVLDVFTGGTQPARLEHNKSDELETATKYFAKEPLPAFKNVEAIISPPTGMSQEDFDQAVLKAAENYPVNERSYNATRGPNSNTYVDDVIESTGAKMPDIKGAIQQNWGEQCSK